MNDLDGRTVSVKPGDGRRFATALRSIVAEYGFGYPVLLDESRDDKFVALVFDRTAGGLEKGDGFAK